MSVSTRGAALPKPLGPKEFTLIFIFKVLYIYIIGELLLHNKHFRIGKAKNPSMHNSCKVGVCLYQWFQSFFAQGKPKVVKSETKTWQNRAKSSETK